MSSSEQATPCSSGGAGCRVGLHVDACEGSAGRMVNRVGSTGPLFQVGFWALFLRVCSVVHWHPVPSCFFLGGGWLPH